MNIRKGADNRATETRVGGRSTRRKRAVTSANTLWIMAIVGKAQICHQHPAPPISAPDSDAPYSGPIIVRIGTITNVTGPRSPLRGYRKLTERPGL